LTLTFFNSRYWLFCAEVFWTRARCRSDYVLFFISFFRSCCSFSLLMLCCRFWRIKMNI